MKIIYTFLVAFFTFSIGGFAQTKPGDTRAAMFAKEATTQLNLGELDYLKIKNLVAPKFKEIDEAAELYKDDTARYEEALAQIEKNYDEKLMAILPKKSQEAYLPLKIAINSAAMSTESKK